MIIADTDVLVDFLRGAGAAARVEVELSTGSLRTTAIAAFELWQARAHREPNKMSGRFWTRSRSCRSMQNLRSYRVESAGCCSPEARTSGWLTAYHRLIAEAYRNGGTLRPLSNELTFVTDEQVLPLRSGRVVAEILALRESGTRLIPVVIELKSARKMKELVAQLEAASCIIYADPASFSHLFSALLAKEVRLSERCERWLIWPAANDAVDPRKRELAMQNILVVSYRQHGSTYRFIR